MADDTNETTSPATPAADGSVVDDVINAAESALDTALAESKSFLSKAQETLASAAGTAVNAVKEHPIAAAGIAAGAAAAVAGAADSFALLNGSAGGPANGALIITTERNTSGRIKEHQAATGEPKS